MLTFFQPHPLGIPYSAKLGVQIIVTVQPARLVASFQNRVLDSVEQLQRAALDERYLAFLLHENFTKDCTVTLQYSPCTDGR